MSIEKRGMEEAKILVQSHFPDLTIESMSVLGEGWDSIALQANHSIIFRIPKRPQVARQMEKEIRVLDAIHPYLSAEIPKIEWIGYGAGEHSLSLVGYRKLSGMPLTEIPLNSKTSHVLEQVGQFLAQLHTIPPRVLEQSDVPWFHWTGDEDSSGKANWVQGLRGFINRILQNVVPLSNGLTRETVVFEFEEFISNSRHFYFQRALIHGDLSPEHILLDEEVDEIRVIDFGDCGMGDPAYDVWPEINHWYPGQVDELFMERQRFYRKLAPFHGVLYGQMVGDKDIVMKGLRDIEKDFNIPK